MTDVHLLSNSFNKFHLLLVNLCCITVFRDLLGFPVIIDKVKKILLRVDV